MNEGKLTVLPRGGRADNAFKVWPTDADQAAFRHAMVNGLSGSEWRESRIVKAHEFFRDQIEQWIGEGEGPDEDANERAEALETALSQLLELVVIDLRSSDNPHIIFETLNARGTPLRQSDLMKNMILHEAEKTGVGDEVAWPFEGAWWDRDIRQGRLYRPRIDVFLNYWLTMRTLQEVGATDMFLSFRRHYEAGEHGAIRDMAADIARVGSAYRSLEVGELEGAWTAFAPRWKVMQAAVVTPVLLWLLSSQAEPDQVVRAIKALESYLVCRMVCRMTTRAYNRVFVDLVRRLEDAGPTRAGDTVIDFLGAREAYSATWPNDNLVLDAISSKPLYRLLTRGRLRMVLEVIEEELRTTKSEGGGVPTDLTIEHIMPRSWRGAWPGPEPGLGPEGPEERRDRLLDSLGNLTLVNQPLNSALSNGPWASKRQRLLEHSTLFLNKDLLEHSQDRGTKRRSGIGRRGSTGHSSRHGPTPPILAPDLLRGKPGDPSFLWLAARLGVETAPVAVLGSRSGEVLRALLRSRLGRGMGWGDTCAVILVNCWHKMAYNVSGKGRHRGGPLGHRLDGGSTARHRDRRDPGVRARRRVGQRIPVRVAEEGRDTNRWRLTHDKHPGRNRARRRRRLVGRWRRLDRTRFASAPVAAGSCPQRSQHDASEAPSSTPARRRGCAGPGQRTTCRAAS